MSDFQELFNFINIDKTIHFVFNIGLTHYLLLSGFIFSVGLIGIILNRKNIITILMCIELIFLSVQINLIAFSAYNQNLIGQIMVIFILTVAAAEIAIGLAVVITYFRNKETISIEDIKELRG